MSTTDPDRAAPWLLAAGYPERVALIGLFASAPWRQLAASDDLLAFADAMAEFDRRFHRDATSWHQPHLARQNHRRHGRTDRSPPGPSEEHTPTPN